MSKKKKRKDNYKMNYSNDKKDFSTFNVALETVGELKKEIQKVWELEKYYREKYFNSSSNASYYFDLFDFFDEKRLELEELLEKYELEMIKKGGKPLPPWILKLK